MLLTRKGLSENLATCSFALDPNDLGGYAVPILHELPCGKGVFMSLTKRWQTVEKRLALCSSIESSTKGDSLAGSAADIMRGRPESGLSRGPSLGVTHFPISFIGRTLRKDESILMTPKTVDLSLVNSRETERDPSRLLRMTVRRVAPLASWGADLKADSADG
jgi:hypothetical protein